MQIEFVTNELERVLGVFCRTSQTLSVCGCESCVRFLDLVLDSAKHLTSFVLVRIAPYVDSAARDNSSNPRYQERVASRPWRDPPLGKILAKIDLASIRQR